MQVLVTGVCFNPPSVRLIGVEAAGEGVDTEKHAATLTKGKIGVLHGAMSYLLQDDDGQVIEAHSISAGLDYPGVGPEHSYLKDLGRAEYSVSRLYAIHPDLFSFRKKALEYYSPSLVGKRLGVRSVLNSTQKRYITVLPINKR